MATTLTAFTTTHGMIVGIHDNTTVVRTTTQPARASGLTRTLQCVVGIAHTTYSCLTSTQNLTSLARRQLDYAVTTLTRGQLSEITSGTYEQRTLSRTQLDVVDYSTHRNVLQRQSITYLGSCFGTTHHSGTHLQTVGSNNITFLTISVEQQGDASRTVRIILDCLYNCWNTIFLSFKIDKAELSLVTAAKVTHGHLAIVVAAARRTLTVYERLLRY